MAKRLQGPGSETGGALTTAGDSMPKFVRVPFKALWGEVTRHPSRNLGLVPR